MGNTLQSLAGDTIFRTTDVLSALHAPLTPEQIVLDRYVFLPYARTGIAAAISAPFDWGLPTRAFVDLRVPVADETRGAIDAEMRVRVYGPADVTEIDVRQVVRTVPRADADNAEIDDLVHVEFDRPDLPWLFTPAGPDAAGRLTPWLTLVVAKRHHLAWGDVRGAVRSAKIRRDQLQPLGDAWAWAHAQVMGARAANATTEPTLERRLSEENAAHNVSRLICPRRLEPSTTYVACVVPTFLAGAQAALGLTPVTTLAPAWGTAANFNAGDPSDMVTLPVFFAWEFSTAEAGNFESLARKLKPAVAPPGVGRRRVDATNPWAGAVLDVDDPGAEIVVNGPIVSPQAPESVPAERWPDEAAQSWAPEVTAELVARLNAADEQAHAPDPAAPVVGPPLYGGLHARQPRVETESPADGQQPLWFRELNIDPRHRIVGGLGTRVVQAEQEDLMLSAWNQVVGIDAANRTLRIAQMAMHASAALHRRHLAALSDAALLSLTERVHAKVLDAPARSVWAALDVSSLPQTVTTGAFRRLVRRRGPLVRTAVRTQAQLPGVVDALTVRADRLTTDWVVAYTAPDGIRGLSDTALARLTPALTAAIFGDADTHAAVARVRESLAKPVAPDLMTPDQLDRGDPAETFDLAASFVAALAQRLVAIFPTEREMEASADTALTGASNATLLRSVISIASGAHIDQLPVSAGDAHRLRLDPVGRSKDGRRVTVSTEALQGFANRALTLARRHGVAAPAADLQAASLRLQSLAQSTRRVERVTLARALATLGARAGVADQLAEPARGRIPAPPLKLIAKLDPKVTVPRRISARLTAGSGRFPSWLRPDWFGDHRIEPVMAHPRFAVPMYEPLYRYDPDWMIPGAGLIPRPDMATLLETNNRFIEAYLVGLNHEMARELLWREFPTDQRGTYFSSFWTGAPELVADLHELPWTAGALGSHVDQALDGQLVFMVRGDLIRRYPGVVAHAALEAGRDGQIPTFAAASPVKTLFHIHLPPNILLVGFSLTQARIRTPGETWWFTLSENPTEPRFGLDPSRVGARTRDELVWSDFGTAPGAFLNTATHTDISFGDSKWGASSAQIAFLLFQLPARAAFGALKMLGQAIPNV
jgi:hypothetical protein